MKKIYLLVFALATGLTSKAQTTFCDTTANVIIYSNYDGGQLTIDVDQNIPNLKIGITTYEWAKITITGTYSANVTEVRYAGYNGNNNHCGLGSLSTSIAGVPANVDTIIFYPAAGYSNSNGWPNIICNYSCNNTSNQGGCNTPDQLAFYFTNAFGGTLRYHLTQYGCWSTTPYLVSAGGNCCIMPSSGVTKTNPKGFRAFPNPATSELNLQFADAGLTHTVQLRNVIGEEVLKTTFNAGSEKGRIDLKSLARGIYIVTVREGEKEYASKIAVE